MPDLNDIGLFVQVVRFGSFAEAGRRLGIPANTVSRRIQELEEQRPAHAAIDPEAETHRCRA